MKAIIATLLRLGVIQQYLWNGQQVDRWPVYGHLYSATGELYMGRWSIIEQGSRAGEVLSFLTRGRYNHCRLHWIRKADRDRELHDHPFNYCTFVLNGWYTEQYIPHDRLNASYMRLWQGSTKCLNGTSEMEQFRTISAGGYMQAEVGQFHRIASVSEDGVWTLFFMGQDTGKWGFLVDGRWMRSSQFFRLRNIDHDGIPLPTPA